MTSQKQNENELLSIHTRDREAHFDTDVDAAVSFFDDSYTYVRDGNVFHLSPTELAVMFKDYFKGVTFHEWDDLEEPIIKISDDGGMAWVIEHFRIRLTRLEEDQSEEQISEYAGITIYEQKQGKWVRIANSSTFSRK